jgi:hypothetical protein
MLEPTNGSQIQNAEGGTTIPSIGSLIKATAVDNADALSDRGGSRASSRAGSRSPGGTQRTRRPLDLSGDNLGFGEDTRALRVLDRAFSA